MSTQASADLIWRVVKGNNAFLKKRREGRGKEGLRLSTEANNVTSTSSFKFSGVAHTGASLQLAESGLVVSRGKKSAKVSTKKPGVAARTATKGRKDLKNASRARVQRLVRLTTRTSRKTWKKDN